MLVVLVSSLTVWVRQQVLDTDNWVQASSELLADEEVRGALSVYLVDQLYENVDVAAQIRAALPPDYAPLSAPVAGAVRDLAAQAADRILARPRLQELWREANRAAHRLFVAVVEEEPVGRLQAEGDEVVLDLRPLIVQLRERLGARGAIPSDAGRVTIMRSDQVDTARAAVRTLNAISLAAGLVSLVLLAAAVWLSPSRRRMLTWTGLGLVAVGLVLLVIRRVAGDLVVDALAGEAVRRPVGTEVWLISTSLLRTVAFGLIVYGLLVLTGAALAGPTRPATAVRRRLAPALHRPSWTYGGLALLLLLGLLVSPTGGRSLAASATLLTAIVVGVEVLRRQAVREFPVAAAASATTAGQSDTAPPGAVTGGPPR